MKKMSLKVVAMVAILMSAIATTSCQNNQFTGKTTLKNSTDSISYSLGSLHSKGFLVNVQRSVPFDTINTKELVKAFAISQLSEQAVDMFKQQFDTISSDAYMYGFNHSLLNKSMISEEVANGICQKAYEGIMQRKEAERRAIADKNLAEGLNYLAENSKNEGVITTESGLQYKVITMGNGPKPSATDKVKVLYTGKLIDGTVFDSTDNHGGEPATLALNRVVKGWTEVIQLMPVGSKFTAYIPAELGYGERETGSIPSNSTLIFDIELVEIVK